MRFLDLKSFFQNEISFKLIISGNLLSYRFAQSKKNRGASNGLLVVGGASLKHQPLDL